jgi:hypothetical protein
MKVLDFLSFVGLGVLIILGCWAAICLPIILRYAPHRGSMHALAEPPSRPPHAGRSPRPEA